jgi:hypothetical protein
VEADYDIFEIVSVFRDFWLVDAESYQRKYYTWHGEPLATGYYVVNWPDGVRVRRFDEHAAFHGPFKSRREAQAALDWMHGLWKRSKEATARALSPMRDASADRKSVKRREAKQIDWGWGGWKPWPTGFPPPVERKMMKPTTQ